MKEETRCVSAGSVRLVARDSCLIRDRSACAIRFSSSSNAHVYYIGRRPGGLKPRKATRLPIKAFGMTVLVGEGMYWILSRLLVGGFHLEHSIGYLIMQTT